MGELRAFYRNYPTVKFQKGEIIIHQDEKPRYVYAIRTGIVEAYNLTRSGFYRVNSFEIADDVIPVCWSFSKTTASLFYYRAYTDCELWAIPKQDFLQKIAESYRFVEDMLDRQMRGYIGTQLQVDALARQHGYTKLLYLFRYLSLRFGRDTAQDRSKIQIPLTQQAIANFSGLTRETATIEINRLKKNGILSCEHRYYTVHSDRLNDEIDDDFNPGISINMLR